MQTAFCLAEGVITLTAHPHPQKSAQTFIQQRRARKGGAQGGKVGFATPNAFPPRNLAHATVSPGKESAIHASRIQALPSRDIHLRLGFILKLLESVLSGVLGVHRTPRIYSDRKPPCRSLYKVPAR